MLRNHYKQSHSQVLTASLQHAVSRFYREVNSLNVVILNQLLNWGQANHVCCLHVQRYVT